MTRFATWVGWIVVLMVGAVCGGEPATAPSSQPGVTPLASVVAAYPKTLPEPGKDNTAILAVQLRDWMRKNYKGAAISATGTITEMAPLRKTVLGEGFPIKIKLDAGQFPLTVSFGAVVPVENSDGLASCKCGDQVVVNGNLFSAECESRVSTNVLFILALDHAKVTKQPAK